MNRFYVYRHLRSDSSEPFYVGKGIGKRAGSKSGRNKYWHHIVNKFGYEIEIMVGGLTEEQAFEKEIEFINLYKKLGYCEANLSTGGRASTSGVPGFWRGKNLTAEAKRKISEKLMGNVSWNTGKSLSAKHKSALSKAHKGLPSPKRKRVIDENGVIYSSITEAAKKLNINRTTLNAMLVGQSKNKTGITYLIET